MKIATLLVLLTATACGAQTPPRSNVQTTEPSSCMRGVDHPELRLNDHAQMPASMVDSDSVEDLLHWQDDLFVPYGAPRSLAAFARQAHVPIVVRLGFHEGSALYTDPAAIAHPEFIHRLNERACSVQTYQRAECTMELRPSIVVRVHDLEGRPIAATVRYTVFQHDRKLISGTFDPSWDLEHGSALVHEDQAEPGSYGIRLEADGYATWSASGLIVRADHCHVETLRLDIRLQRLR